MSAGAAPLRLASRKRPLWVLYSTTTSLNRKALGRVSLPSAFAPFRFYFRPSNFWGLLHPTSLFYRNCGNRLELATFPNLRGFSVPVYLPAVKSLLQTYERYTSPRQLSGAPVPFCGIRHPAFEHEGVVLAAFPLVTISFSSTTAEPPHGLRRPHIRKLMQS